MSIHVMVSFSRDAAGRLVDGGPRRDLLEIAARTGAEVDFAADGARSSGWRRRLLGPHVRQAWRLARRVKDEDIILADGEHTGLPLLLFLALRRRHPRRVVIIGHLVSRPWKRAALAVATRLGTPGTLVLHSVEQVRRTRGVLGRAWTSELVAYQVDTEFWTAGAPVAEGGRPLIVAAGSEHRDYGTLAEAARGLGADVVIAAGSHWARSRATAGDLPPNVRFLDTTLDFAALRDLYRSASAVVVPLFDVPNQSGVTTILEAMSCGRPVVVSATVGQRECVRGPLIGPDGAADTNVIPARGPQLFGHAGTSSAWTGLYAQPGDADSLRQALALLLEDRALAASLATQGRRAACESFSLERFVDRLVAVINADASPGLAADQRKGTALA